MVWVTMRGRCSGCRRRRIWPLTGRIAWRIGVGDAVEVAGGEAGRDHDVRAAASVASVAWRLAEAGGDAPGRHLGDRAGDGAGRRPWPRRRSGRRGSGGCRRTGRRWRARRRGLPGRGTARARGTAFASSASALRPIEWRNSVSRSQRGQVAAVVGDREGALGAQAGRVSPWRPRAPALKPGKRPTASRFRLSRSCSPKTDSETGPSMPAATRLALSASWSGSMSVTEQPCAGARARRSRCRSPRRRRR